MRPIVFLHIPKTAGQTVHNEIARVVGSSAVSPIRVHTQAGQGAPQMPPGYRVYSGHIDWTELDSLDNPFAFTVLRDPRERLASFYFYLLKEAEALTPAALAQAHNTGKRMVLTETAEDYFFGGAKGWQRFIDDHYDNFYCSYLATRKIRGSKEMAGLTPAQRVTAARTGAAQINGIYTTRDLRPLEADLAQMLGAPVNLVGNYHNSGALDRGERRWPRLLDRMDSDASIRRLEGYVAADLELMDALGVEV